MGPGKVSIWSECGRFTDQTSIRPLLYSTRRPVRGFVHSASNSNGNVGIQGPIAKFAMQFCGLTCRRCQALNHKKIRLLRSFFCSTVPVTMIAHAERMDA